MHLSNYIPLKNFVKLVFEFELSPLCVQLIRVLEGGDPVVPIGLDLNTVGSRSGHLPGVSSQRQPKLRGNHSRKLSH